jgi:hypothetical protein
MIAQVRLKGKFTSEQNKNHPPMRVVAYKQGAPPDTARHRAKSAMIQKGNTEIEKEQTLWRAESGLWNS